MIGANTTISAYKAQRSNGKDTFSESALVAGLPAIITRESMERASLLDMANMHLIYRMTIDVDTLNLIAGDKIVDEQNTTYRVHSLDDSPRMAPIGARRVFILRKQA